ncbi:MAG: molybdopterin-synthase adenylyltransferase MoeB [Proteobacteria bacterium]|jgi:adenylyltransferase/sulfurtransferase|nr:molybdopterin-synthase adenylyltransferase MoeB [Pseudomonadota bacterium]
MDDAQLLRYSRQIMLPQFDVAGQQKLLDATVLIIGLGGLGSPAAMYLAAAGVGHLVLVDFDTVELSNLQRQIIHHTDDIGRPKVESARDALRKLNPDVKLTLVDHKLEGMELQQHITAADVVLDGSDNFATRFAVNDACVAAGVPLVSGAAIRMEGQVAVFLNNGDGPCYRCLYREEGELDNRCSENGVLAPLVGIIGAIQATEAIKILAGMGETLHGRLLLLDALHMEWRTLTLKKDPGCSGCGTA